METLDLDCGNLTGNEGAIKIGEALKTNTSLKTIKLSLYRLSDEEAKLIGEALKSNTSLEKVFLSIYEIGVEGKNAIEDSLKYNTSLKQKSFRFFVLRRLIN